MNVGELGKGCGSGVHGVTGRAEEKVDICMV
jgi:hypothetical protein